MRFSALRLAVFFQLQSLLRRFQRIFGQSWAAKRLRGGGDIDHRVRACGLSFAVQDLLAALKDDLISGTGRRRFQKG